MKTGHEHTYMSNMPPECMKKSGHKVTHEYRIWRRAAGPTLILLGMFASVFVSTPIIVIEDVWGTSYR